MDITVEDINDLGEERFEKLCQALLAKVIGPGVTIFGDARDGAREATYPGKAKYPSEVEQWDGEWIFQVKYTNFYNGLDKARQKVKGLIRPEAVKLKKYSYFENGKCDYYIFISNVPFSGVSETGTHDQVHKIIDELKVEYPFKNIHCWDGNKILTLLNGFPEIKEVFFPSDLQKVHKKLEETNDLRAKKAEIDSKLEDATNLIDNFNPSAAITLLKTIEEKLWDYTDDLQKYKTLSGLGRAHLELVKDDSQASYIANCFIKAFNFNKNSANAKCNAAVGKQILNNPEEAIKLAQSVLSEDETNDSAYSILVSSSPVTSSIEDVIEKVPKEYRGQARTANSIARFALKKGNLVMAKEWLEKAIASAKNDKHFDVKGELAGIIVGAAIDEKKKTGNVSEETKLNLAQAVSLLTELWDKVKDTELRNRRLPWFANRAIAKYYLGNPEEAMSDFDNALEADPQNVSLIVNRADVALKANMISDKIINSVKEVYFSHEMPNLPSLLIDLLSTKNRDSEAIEITEKNLEKLENEPWVEEVKMRLVSLYIDSDNFDKAKSLNEKLLEKNPKCIHHKINEFLIIKNIDGIEKAKKCLIEAYGLIDNNTTYSELYNLANNLFDFKLYKEAAEVYEKFVDVSLPNILTKKLLACYCEINKQQDAIKIASNLRLKYGLLKDFSLKEARLLFEIGDTLAAKNIQSELASLYPEDININLNLAIFNHKLGDFKKVDDFLKQDFNFEAIGLEPALLLANLFLERQIYNKAVELAYETLRRYPSDPLVNDNYCTIFLFASNHLGQLRNLNKSDFDTAIKIKDNKVSDRWYILEKRKDTNPQLGEINQISNEKIFKELRNKSVGDKVVIGDVVGSTNEKEVLDVIHKYTLAFDKSREFCSSMGYESQIVHGHIPEDITPEQFKALMGESIKRLNKDKPTD